MRGGAVRLFRRTRARRAARARARGCVVRLSLSDGAGEGSSPPGPVSRRERGGPHPLSPFRNAESGDEGNERRICMLAVLRRRLEMAVRVRDFLLAHRAEGIQGAEAAGLARLEELIARAEALAGPPRAGRGAPAGAPSARAQGPRAPQS